MLMLEAKLNNGFGAVYATPSEKLSVGEVSCVYRSAPDSTPCARVLGSRLRRFLKAFF